ncbi:MAG: hypothetical protein IT559_02615 [Alphaproteobacteria bacterium]|nr:hypothetical protein [Alphaproteobacteria bacterium]
MKPDFLSFLIAGALVTGIFLVNRGFEGDVIAAHAATSAFSVHEIEKGASVAPQRRRALRRAISTDSKNLLDQPGYFIRAVLSEPEMIRRDSPTVVWQYRNASCVLDLYYTTQQKNELKAPVVHYEIRAREKGVRDEDVQESCVRDLARAHSGKNFIRPESFYRQSY